METNSTISKEAILKQIISAINNFRSICEKYDSTRKIKNLTIVDSVIRKYGKTEFVSKAIPVYSNYIFSLLKEDTIKLSQTIKPEDSVIILTNIVATFFQNDKDKIPAMIGQPKIKVDFSSEYDYTFNNANAALSKYSIQSGKKQLDGIFYTPQNNSEQVNESVLATIGIIAATIAVQAIAGYAITRTILSSPSACSWVRNTAEKYPVATGIIKFFAFTDIDKICEQDKINKGEINPDEDGADAEDEDIIGDDSDNSPEEETSSTEVTNGDYKLIELDDNGNVIRAIKK